ncbi:membrane protein DedA with SNARE-associated domain [Alkalispirillum mobile]|uniref:Membrane protein DedA with SNARE-associated domain n=1 Tax=Alkalispirillum mobile TaxID=85925 RepID=A0A498C0W0_9GAMM|nr:DedA family protein [Alkalispirillum mobile]RLK48707.1 membrane protein DedA with SNARE-associated domain [Alkalispirillum mobile]
MDLGPLVKALADSPLWLAAGLFVIVMLESLLVIGYLIPAASIVFVVGALAASDPLLLLPAFAGAASGALVGGAANYALGYRLRDRTPRLWPFSHHPGLLERNQAFLARHGALSLIVCRFAKPMRSTLPAVAGMLDMDRRLFFISNLLSAPLWAVVWLGLGLGAGTSLEAALGEAGRAALPFLAAAVLLAGLGWLWGRRRLRKGLPSGARHWRLAVIALVTLGMVVSVLELVA